MGSSAVLMLVVAAGALVLGDSGEAERGSGIGLKLFGFILEPVFTFILESCSGSPRNAVRDHPGIAFTLARIPQVLRVITI